MIAEKLGYAHPRQWLKEVSAKDVSEWLAFYRVRAEKEEDAAREARHQAKADELARKMSKGG